MTTLALGKSIHSIFTYVKIVDDYSISIISDISKTFFIVSTVPLWNHKPWGKLSRK